MNMHLLRKFVAAASLAGVSLLSWVSCSNQPTEIVAGVTTQLQVPKYLKMVGVTVQLGGRLLFCEAYPVFDGTVTLPSTIGVVPPDDAETVPSDPVTMQILGFRTEQPTFSNDCIANIPDAGEDDVFVVRRRRLSYVADTIAYLPMPLRESCSSVNCADDETCVGGMCESMDISTSDLAAYSDGFVFGNTNTCFNVSACMGESALAPVALTNESDCTFRTLWPDTAPTPEAGHLNVRLVYDSFGVEVLDLDDKEGFILPDPTDPLTFKLAPNMCEGVFKAGRVLQLSASALCRSKRPLQPICEDDLKDIQDGSYGVQGGSNDLCPVEGGVLQQTESALYVLMDSSAAMSEYFGPDGLSFAVETPLNNPIAARTRVGFSYLPAASCSDSASYVSPTFGFAEVGDIRDDIGNSLADPASVQADNPELNLEAAMQGAYSALDALTPVSSAQFNRRAVLIIGNRNFEGSCSPSPDAVAATAQGQGLHTYVVGLPAPAATPLVGDPVTAGSAIATAGGTSFFDATVDEGEGAVAVNEIINDLGSCLYDAPLDTVLSNQELPSDAQLSYLDPLTLTRVDIQPNAQCADGVNVDGFHQPAAGEPVRICGQPCADLRQVLTDAALFYAIQGMQAPRIPVQVSTPCP